MFDMAYKEKQNKVADKTISVTGSLIKTKTNNRFRENDYLELMFKLHEIIDLAEEGKISKLDCIESFVLSYDIVLSLLDKLSTKPEFVDELKEFIGRNEKKLFELIKHSESPNKIFAELRKILSDTEYFKEKQKAPISQAEFSYDSSNKYKGNNIDFSKLDDLYKKLYEAIEKNDIKKITSCRGRLIRALKRNKSEIEKVYEDVKILEEINTLIDEGKSISEISELLNREENKKYKYYFGECIADKSSFKTKFKKLYEENKVRKIVLYYNALNEELKEHGEVLKERYSSEFLEKKAKLKNLTTMLPNAVGLSIKKLNNTINELKNARTNRKKLSKLIDVAKDTGRVIGTPALYLGKFVANNWYSIYALLKGSFSPPKKKQENEENSKDPEQIIDTDVNLQSKNRDNNFKHEKFSTKMLEKDGTITEPVLNIKEKLQKDNSETGIPVDNVENSNSGFEPSEDPLYGLNREEIFTNKLTPTEQLNPLYGLNREERYTNKLTPTEQLNPLYGLNREEIFTHENVPTESYNPNPEPTINPENVPTESYNPNPEPAPEPTINPEASQDISESTGATVASDSFDWKWYFIDFPGTFAPDISVTSGY